jgi:hypothetical protein
MKRPTKIQTMKNKHFSCALSLAASTLILYPALATAATNIVEGSFFVTYNPAQPNWQGVSSLSGMWSFEYDEPSELFDGTLAGVNLSFDSNTVGTTTFDSSNVTATVNIDPGQILNSISFTGGSVGDDSSDYFIILYGGFSGEIGPARVSSSTVSMFNLADNPVGPFGSTSGGFFTVTQIPEASSLYLSFIGLSCLFRRRR